MLATSWKATGLIRPVWNRLPVPKGKREELARLTGIPATNLSAMNTGNMPMTMAAAQKIVAAVDGITVRDLGAPATRQEAQAEGRRLAYLEHRLSEVEAALNLLGPDLAALGAVVERVAALERRVPARTARVRRAGA